MISPDRPNEDKEELQEKLRMKNTRLIPQFDRLLESFDHDQILKFLTRYKGIPTPEQRLKFWGKILECEQVKRDEGAYHKLLRMEGDPNIMMTIEQDVNRTFPYYTYFNRGGIGQEILYRILKAYSVYDPELGYCQGMAYIAAVVLLHYKEEEDAFWTFARMMKRPDFDFESVFSRNLIKLKVSLSCIKRLLEIECPRLSQYFKSLELGPEIYCCSSFCTLFTMYFQFETTTQIWDIFFLQGWNFLMKLQLGILKRLEATLLSSGFIEVQSVINQNLEAMNPGEIWEVADKIIINEKQLKMWEAEERQIVLEKELRKKNNRGLGREEDGELDSMFNKLKDSFSYEDDVKSKMDHDEEGGEKVKIKEETNEDDIMDGLFGTLEAEEKEIEAMSVSSIKKKGSSSLLFGLEEEEEDKVDFGDVSNIQDYLGQLDGGKKEEKEGAEDFTFSFDDEEKKEEESEGDEFAFEFD